MSSSRLRGLEGRRHALPCQRGCGIRGRPDAGWRLGPSALRATADKGSLRLALWRLRSEGPCRFDYSRLQCEPQVFERCRDPGSRFVCCAGETFAIPVGCTGDAPPQAAPTLVKELARYVEQRGLL